MPDGCAPRLGPPVAQMLLLRANVPLLVAHIPKEGPTAIPEKAGLVPVYDNPGVRGGLKIFICVALVMLLVLAALRFGGFRLKISLRFPPGTQSCCGGGQENHIGFPFVTR